jgi:lantibiotic leader peptide-processing serine protease
MKPVKLASLVVAGMALLSACAEDPVVPRVLESTGHTAAASRELDMTAAMTEAPSKHILFFRGKAPSDLGGMVSELGGTLALNHKIGVAVVTGLTEDAAATLKASAGAAFVESAPQFQLIEPAAVSQPGDTELASAALAAGDMVSSAEAPASANYFFAQWNLQQIGAPAAWTAGRRGNQNVTVAILDTGIDYLLPDLAGLVDLDRSTSFEPVDDVLTQHYFPGRHPSTDLHYHGTNVATQVASNAVWFAGVTSGTTLMSVKVCSVVGGCNGVIEGILYAIDNGADVINMSLGGWFSKAAFPGAVSAYNALMNYAKQEGVTIVVSAGNDSNDLDRHHNIGVERDAAGNIITRAHVPSFFATYCDATHVICVSATRRNDVAASYTNYGRSAIDVAAPGGAGGDWVYSLCPETSLLFNCTNPDPNAPWYIGVAGTSQAAPHVAGLAALAVEDVGRDPAKVRSYIRNSADAIGGGNTPFYGKGRINVARAVGAN